MTAKMLALAAMLQMPPTPPPVITVSPGPVIDSRTVTIIPAPFPTPFDASRDSNADVDAALAAARTSGKHVLVVFGAGWCHDSRALVDVMAGARTQAMLEERYHIVWVHVPIERNLRAIPVAHRLGLGDVEGTPTVLILRPDGTPVNLDDAQSWRNAASRKPAAIHRALERAVSPP